MNQQQTFVKMERSTNQILGSFKHKVKIVEVLCKNSLHVVKLLFVQINFFNECDL